MGSRVFPPDGRVPWTLCRRVSARRRALLAVVDHCTVHNSIRIPPEVRVTLAGSVETTPRHSVTVGG